jgi:hypothetical protein
MDQLFGTIIRDTDQIKPLFRADRFGFTNIFTDAASDTFSLTKIDSLFITRWKQRIGGTKLGTVAAVGTGFKINLFVKKRENFPKTSWSPITHHLFERVFKQNTF